MSFLRLTPFLATLLLAALLSPAAALAARAEDNATGRAEVLDGQRFQQAEPRGHTCAITFDDGPGKHTAHLLDILQEHGVRATFFVLGQNVEKAPDLVRRMVREGHEVDNHSYDHPQLRHLTDAQQQGEIERTETLLKSLGASPRFFRPPYGSYNADTLRDAARDNLLLALWSVDSLDWKYRTLRGLEGQVLPKGHGAARGIFLFHDIHRTTVEAMPELLDRLAQEGCRFVTLGEWLDLHPLATAAPAR